MLSVHNGFKLDVSKRNITEKYLNYTLLNNTGSNFLKRKFDNIFN